MKYQLLAIDVDGTLLDEEHRLSKENQKALEQVLQSGTKVVLCSGRGYWALKNFIEQLGIRNAVITQNGSQITDYTGENILHEEMISVENCRKILEYCVKNGYHPLIYQQDNVYGDLQDRYLEIFERCMNQKVIYTEDIEQTYAQIPLGKILVLDEPKRILQIQNWMMEQFRGQLLAELAYDFSLEIGGSDKGKALKWLAGHYQIPRENILAIGDGENDKGMLQYAGFGVAMGSAMPGVKAVADAVTLSNNESGVAEAIRRYM